MFGRCCQRDACTQYKEMFARNGGIIIRKRPWGYSVAWVQDSGVKLPEFKPDLLFNISTATG